MPTTRATVRIKRLRAVARGTTVVNNVGTYVDVQDDDVTIATNVDTINVTGSASVTDNGSGKVTINVTGGGISGILLKDEGSSVGTFATINVTGDATVTDAGSGVATLNVSGGGISGILLKDEGSSVGTFATLNVTGAAAVSDAGSGVATLNVPGGISGVLFKDEGTSVGTFATVNVTGAATLSDAGSGVATLNISGGISGILLKDEGSSVGTFATLNVTGAAAVTDAGSGVATLNVPGGISGVLLKDEGTSIGTFATINVTGDATVTDAGSGVATLNVTGGTSGNGSTGAVHTVPLASAFTTTVGTGLTLTDATAALLFQAAGHGASFDVQLAVLTAPSSPWVRYFRFEMNPVQKQYLYGGFAIRRSSSGAFVLWSLVHSGTGLELQYSEYSGPTSRASVTAGVPLDPTAVYFKIEDDGTNFVLSASPGGEAGTYVTVHSVGNTAYFASYDQIGFAADAYNGTTPNRDCIMAIQHYAASAPTYAAGSASGIGGTTDHASLTNRAWSLSGHTGTASTVAGFDGTGTAVTRATGTTGLALLDDATQADARTTLGLGDSATLNVGTTAGTVAAGDHVHSTYMTQSQALTIASLRL
jgi:hypothetical protein